MTKITTRGSKAWVTFTAPVSDCGSVHLKGSWNDWQSEPMKRKKSGEFYLTKILKTGQSYQFGYVVDGVWVVDEELPRIGTPYGSENSVLKL